eukprot:gene3584-13668_t
MGLFGRIFRRGDGNKTAEQLRPDEEMEPNSTADTPGNMQGMVPSHAGVDRDGDSFSSRTTNGVGDGDSPSSPTTDTSSPTTDGDGDGDPISCLSTDGGNGDGDSFSSLTTDGDGDGDSSSSPTTGLSCSSTTDPSSIPTSRLRSGWGFLLLSVH